MHSPIIIPAETSLGGIIINGVISFPQPENPFEKRRIAIITKNPIKNLTVSIDNKMYPIVEYLNTSSRYSSNIVYTIEPDETVFKSTNKKIKLSANNKHVFVNIVQNPLKCSDKLTVVESLKNVYFNGTKDAKSIITAVLVWIEYNLAIGVDQIFINQSTFDKSHEFEVLFKLIKPYIETEKVVLVLYDTKFVRYSRQHTIMNTCLYLNKGRTEWFATHDFDEFICPMNGEWKDNTNLVSILKSLQPNVNNIVTRMIRCDMTNGTYIKPTNIDVDYMKGMPKIYC